MGLSKFDYDGYGTDFIVKADCYDVGWMNFSLKIWATKKELLNALPNCACGWIKTGGNGHYKHVRVYSVHKLRSIFPSIEELKIRNPRIH